MMTTMMRMRMILMTMIGLIKNGGSSNFCLTVKTNVNLAIFWRTCLLLYDIESLPAVQNMIFKVLFFYSAWYFFIIIEFTIFKQSTNNLIYLIGEKPSWLGNCWQLVKYCSGIYIYIFFMHYYYILVWCKKLAYKYLVVATTASLLFQSELSTDTAFGSA